MKAVEQWRSLTGAGDLRGLDEDPSALHVTFQNPQTEQEKQALLITGLFSPEKYLTLLGGRLRKVGTTTHNLEHRIGANLVVGMRKRVAERADQLAQETGEPITLIGYSLGGYFAADLHQREPELVRKTVTIASPISPMFGIKIPEGEEAVSIASPLDTVVPIAFSVNPSFTRQ